MARAIIPAALRGFGEYDPVVARDVALAEREDHRLRIMAAYNATMPMGVLPSYRPSRFGVPSYADRGLLKGAMREGGDEVAAGPAILVAGRGGIGNLDLRTAVLHRAGLSALGEALPTTPGALATKMVQDVTAVNDALYAKLASVGTVAAAWQSLTGTTFKEDVDRWHANALTWQQMMADVVASGDQQKFIDWSGAGVNLMSSAQALGQTMQEQSVVSIAGRFVTDMPTAVGVAWQGLQSGVSTVVKTAGDLSQEVVEAAKKPVGSAVSFLSWRLAALIGGAILLVGGGLYVIGKGAKAGGVKIAVPGVPVSVGGFAPSRSVRRRPRRRRRRT